MKYFLILFLVVIVALGGFWLYGKSLADDPLSPDQQELVEAFGQPDRFVLSYLPQESPDGIQLARSETWVYDDHGASVSFIAGEVIAHEASKVQEGLTYSDAVPTDFSFEMGYEDVVAALGNPEVVEPIDMAPDLYIEGEVETYATDHTFFTLEAGHLVYLETLGLGGGS